MFSTIQGQIRCLGKHSRQVEWQISSKFSQEIFDMKIFTEYIPK